MLQFPSYIPVHVQWSVLYVVSLHSIPPHCTRAQHGWSDSCVCSHLVWPVEHPRRAGDHQPTQTIRHRLARGLPCRLSAPRHISSLQSHASETSCHIGNTDRGHYIAHVHRSNDGRSYRRTGRPSTYDSLRWLYRFLDSRRPVHSRRLRYSSRQNPQLRCGRRAHSPTVSRPR